MKVKGKDGSQMTEDGRQRTEGPAVAEAMARQAEDGRRKDGGRKDR